MMLSDNKELKVIELKAELFDLRNKGEAIQKLYSDKYNELQSVLKEVDESNQNKDN